jgi:hypothetical protein
MYDTDMDFGQLIKYLRGKLNDEDREEVERRLAEDPALHRLMLLMSDFRDESETIDWDILQSPAHALLDRLLKDVKASRKDDAKKRGITTFDSRLLPLPEGIRPATVETRRLKYQLGDSQLDISLYPISPGSYELIGQLSGLNTGEVLDIQLCRGQTKLSARSNEFQLFLFPRVPTGSYQIQIEVGGKVIGMADIEL